LLLAWSWHRSRERQRDSLAPGNSADDTFSHTMTGAGFGDLLKKRVCDCATSQLGHAVPDPYLEGKSLPGDGPDDPSYKDQQGNAQQELHGSSIDRKRSSE